MDHLRVLLIQARRPGDPVRSHERECFARHCGLREEQLVPHDLVDGLPSARMVGRFDAVMVGGSGEFYVSRRDLPRFEAVLELFAEIVARRQPMFASCFGYQMLVQALGGEIVHDPENTEVGSFELELTDCGRKDPLFGALPARFYAQLGHKDRATRHPPGISNLASSERSPFQALRVPGAPIWGVQFHPELDRENNLKRFKSYLEGYAQHLDEDERQEAFDSFKESPEACRLPRSFLDLIFDT